ncbi:MAG: Fic family protein [Synergistaceae bacterium]|jgi:Fic family protein|nr:Fic family protein [Synergistaceae bacterium]
MANRGQNYARKSLYKWTSYDIILLKISVNINKNGGQKIMSDAKKYLTSHPWIKFQLDLSQDIPFRLWILLGAAESKCRHLAGIPLRPEKQNELNKVSLRKGAQATTAIEGNSLSEEEIGKIMDNKDERLPLSKEYQRIEVLNVIGAYNAIIDSVNRLGTCGAGYEELLSDNRAILSGLELGSGLVPGEIRTHSVGVGNYRGAPAEDCEYLLKTLFRWIGSDWELGSDHKTIEGILKAIVAHLYITWIHPFGDGNGRSARMLEFRLLMASGVPMTAAHLLTTHYNVTRAEYYRALASTSQNSGGNPVAFILYALQGFVDALDEQIKTILAEQLRVTWENYVHYEEFNGTLSDAQARQRDLLLELSKFTSPVTLNELKRRLSSELLAKYDKKTIRAFNRDINDLERRNLIVKTAKGISAATGRMRAFLPVCKQSEF